MNGLSIIHDVFKKPLQASLASNRCIILHCFVQSCEVVRKYVSPAYKGATHLSWSGKRWSPLACHETPPKEERDMQWHPKHACEGDWEGVILRLEMKSTAELAAFRGVPLPKSNKHLVILLSSYTQIFGNFGFCVI